MILKALCDYYERRQDVLPPYKKEFKEIDFIIVINSTGQFVRFEDMRSDDRKSAARFMVERHVARTSGKSANFLYDNCSYVLGISDKPKDGAEKLDCFKQLVEKVHKADMSNPRAKALYTFYNEKWDFNLQLMGHDSLWEQISSSVEKGLYNYSFRYEDDIDILASNQELAEAYKSVYPEQHNSGICLVTGLNSDIVDVTSATPIKDSQRTAKLVSFQVKQGYDSYGKEQGENAPISDYAEFAYTTALNHLLSKDSPNKFVIGSKTYVFWVSSANNDESSFDEALSFYIGDYKKDVDTPEYAEKMRSVFEAVYSGKTPVSSNDSFYILGLKPNVARIAVCYWAEIPLREFCGNMLRHLDDFGIISRKPVNCGVKSILRSVTRGGDLNDTVPNLSEALIKSIFEALPYPATLFNAAVRRIRAEQYVGASRAALIKATLNRTNLIQKLHYMLNKEFDNTAYLCGRLFAVIDKLQQDVNGISTVRERYINAASTTPALVFPTILRLSNHHAQKISNPGKFIYYDKLKKDIIGRLNCLVGFPSVLSLKEQGNFFVGYYQQMEEFFKPKEDGLNEIQSTDENNQ